MGSDGREEGDEWACAGYYGRECLVVRETVWLGEGGSVLTRSNEGGMEGA